MKIINRIIKGSFVKRLNRFVAIVELEGREELVHVPNTGRCREIFIPGATVLVELRESKTRKFPYELIMAYKGDRLISIDSQAPNRIVEEAARNKRLEGLSGYDYIKREVSYRSSRFDIFLKKDEKSDIEDSCFIEVKGVTLEADNVAMFPDAPTERGARHLRELAAARSEGYRTMVIFLVQMEGIKYFTPNRAMDAKFAEALKYAYDSGVEVFSYDCRVVENEIVINRKISVVL